MPRIGRKQSATGIYHVMLRGINRQDIFEDEDDYWTFIRIIASLAERMDDNLSSKICACHIYAYCLMPNHIHLLIAEKDWTLGEVMKSVAAAYVFHYNKKYGRVGCSRTVSRASRATMRTTSSRFSATSIRIL